MIVVNGLGIENENVFGVQRNTIELLNELDKIIPEGMIQLLISNNATRKFCYSNIKVVKINLPNVKGKRKYWYLWVFPHYVRSHKALGMDFTLGLPIWGCDIIALYDCITERYKENARTIKEKLSRLSYILRVKINVRKSKLIIADSNYAKNDIAIYYNVNPDKIKVIYCGWQHIEKVKQDDSILNKLSLIDGTYIFALGSRYKHKNTKWILEAAKTNPQYKFVISGSNNLNSSENELLNTNLSNVIFTGYLSDEEIKALMNHCKVFVQPSLCEGFGIPPMEAMSVGANCIVSNRASLPEVYLNSVWYIDPEDYDNINIDKIMQSSKNDNDVILNLYSWKKSALELFNYLKAL